MAITNKESREENYNEFMGIIEDLKIENKLLRTKILKIMEQQKEEEPRYIAQSSIPKEPIVNQPAIHELSEMDKALPDNDSFKKKKNKILKLPFGMFGSEGKVLRAAKKKNAVLVFYLRTNRYIEVLIANVVDERIKIKDKIYAVPTDAVFLWKGKIPAIIQPEWQLTPLSMNQIYDKEEALVYEQKVIIKNLEREKVKEKSKLNMGWIIWVIVLGILAGGLYVMINKYGKKK